MAAGPGELTTGEYSHLVAQMATCGDHNDFVLHDDFEPALLALDKTIQEALLSIVESAKNDELERSSDCSDAFVADKVMWRRVPFVRISCHSLFSIATVYPLVSLNMSESIFLPSDNRSAWGVGALGRSDIF